MLRLLFLHRKKAAQDFQGFTVIELMIVMIITGILTAIALPAFLNQVDKSRYAKARLQMRCMLQELKVYRLNHGSYPRIKIEMFLTILGLSVLRYIQGMLGIDRISIEIIIQIFHFILSMIMNAGITILAVILR